MRLRDPPTHQELPAWGLDESAPWVDVEDVAHSRPGFERENQSDLGIPIDCASEQKFSKNFARTQLRAHSNSSRLQFTNERELPTLLYERTTELTR